MTRAVAPLGTVPRVLAGRYELLGMLAQGGMGEIWRARHLALDRIVAVKRLRRVDGDSSERLLDEALALARVRHPSIVQVHDCGFDDEGAPFLVMELLDGQSLAEHLARTGPLGAINAIRLLLPVLSGLGAAHDAGIVHRDLKPENIVLVPTKQGTLPVLVDFGIAYRQRVEHSRLTQAGTIVGTPAYMAPEQIMGLAGDARTDIWGLITVLYEAASGSVPFAGATTEDLFRALSFAPPPFPAHVPDLDGKLWAILIRGLRKQPDERFTSCLELETELRAWLDHQDRGRRAASGELAVAPQLPSQRPSSEVPTRPAVATPLDTLVHAQRSKR